MKNKLYRAILIIINIMAWGTVAWISVTPPVHATLTTVAIHTSA